jgi:predicted PurR-regulated permease PerM
MPPPEPSPPAYLEHRALLLLLLAVSLALAWILLPFYGTLLWAYIIALLLSPVSGARLRRLPRRRTAAALLTLLVALVLVVVPFTLLSATLAREAIALVQRAQSGDWSVAGYLHGLFDALPAWVMAGLEHFQLADFDALQRRLTAAVTQGGRVIATQALSIGQDTFEFVAQLFITTYVAFFLIRDGDVLASTVRRATPLSAAHQAELTGKFTTVIRATVKGNLLVAAIQGALGALAFWFLGIGGALLWGALMALLSLLPAVGAALVWGPVALYLLASGSPWQGLGLAAYGVLVIGLVDNLLRPVLVGKDTQMPDYVVLVTTLGGMAAFGLNGFVLGPTIGAMFIAVWHLYMVTRADPPP